MARFIFQTLPSRGKTPTCTHTQRPNSSLTTFEALKYNILKKKKTDSDSPGSYGSANLYTLKIKGLQLKW
jgi:hypothetical protein